MTSVTRTAVLAAAIFMTPLTPPPRAAATFKAELLKDFARQRAAVIRYLAAAPDSVLTYRPTPGVRSFAEQIEHVALAADLLSAALAGEASEGTMTPGACRCLATRAHLQQYVESAFARTMTRLDAHTEAHLESDLSSFGQRQSRRAWFSWIREHTAWTLGQTVPYLRAHGVQPPPYLPF